MISYYNKTSRTMVHRHKERGTYDHDAIHRILDEGLVGHVGFVADDQPYVIPVLYARDGERIYLHGSPLSRLLRTLAQGVRMCLTVTLVDGLVLARSAFHHSVNYRSVVVLGTATAVTDPTEKRNALTRVVEHVIVGRPQDARGPTNAELKATEVIALEIEEVSAKVRTGPPVDSKRDYANLGHVWAGELPLTLVPGQPIPDDRCAVAVPAYVSEYRRG
jgi:nitroimidazol reductase NimA-like FMN-containing flavoprotein (pyridoxamine 5'-phosphate oxidase superfamily)